jgi:acyl carrier protein
VKTDGEIQSMIQRILVDVFEVDAESIVPEARLEEDLGLDSLDSLDLGVTIEGKLGVKLDHTALAPLRTIGEIRDYLVRSLV